MTQAVCSLEHPIIFIFDYDYDGIEIPEYNEAQVVSANEYCLSARVISDVDGDVKIGLNENISTTNMIEVFKGKINTPNNKLAVITSQNEKLLEADGLGEKTGLQVFVDNESFPEHIEIITFVI